jgi:pyruvate formate-lyase/glycerol dehydratase family glycyl radical enzyme
VSSVYGDKKVKDVGTRQESLTPTCSERVKRAKNRVLRPMEICLERVRAEMRALEQHQNEPRVIQRARIFETYLKEKTIYILEDELIAGNITSKVRGASFSSEMSRFVDEELGDPVKDFEIRPYEKIMITPEERREIREVLIPYFKGKTLGDYILEIADDEVKEKAFSVTSSCPHIPVIADLSLDKDVGHQMANYEKVLHKGLKGIREEVEWYMAQLDQPYQHFGLQEKRDFYKAVLIALDAAMAYARRYADLAREMAAKEGNPKRKQELEHMAEVCQWVPANPARDWWEALQSVWMIHVLIHCDVYNLANSLGRFDQYMYSFYKKSVIDQKTMSHDEALELLECFWIKFNEWAILLSYDVASYQPGQGLSQTITIGGQTQDGRDACNEVTMLCLEAEEQLARPQPEFAMRIWEGTPGNYLKKAAELIRLGWGKPKFIGDRKAIQMMAKAYPDRTVEDWRQCVMMGCSELCLPHITMQHSWEGVCILPKILELALNNGKCALCGRQIGPLTGDPRTFDSMAAVRQALREQVFYWMKHMTKGIKVVKEAQAERMMAPFCSSLSEGPLQKGLDLCRGGAWYTTYGVYLAGLADTADSLAVIDKLIYLDKKVTWDHLLEAIKANWEGQENLRQLCINGVPKYGNDNDFADSWASWVMDTWYDSVDWINTQKNLVSYYGGLYIGAGIIGQNNVTFGPWPGALPDGRIHPKPLADCISPSPGVDKNGPTAVIKSVGKLPTHRFAMGGPLNLRLSYQLLATDRDLDNFVSFLRTVEELGIYHTQFNVISSDLLRKAMKEPENYRDLLVRVASYCAYFCELTEEQQFDIINRTEQQGW